MQATPQSLSKGSHRTSLEGWVLHEYDLVNSTNLVACTLPPWSAVRSARQTSGRGRFQRTWVSDEGGVWLSAVLPTPAGTADWKLLPLAAGAAVCDALASLGVPGIRMRWPNDVLVDNRKISGLLLDSFAPDRTVVGIGINVWNQPEAIAPTLRNQVARLAEYVQPVPSLTEVARVVLGELRTAWQIFEDTGLTTLTDHINGLWGGAHHVELELDPEGSNRSPTSRARIVQGKFTGVDSAGRLILAGERTEPLYFEPYEVRHLTELD